MDKASAETKWVDITEELDRACRRVPCGQANVSAIQTERICSFQACCHGGATALAVAGRSRARVHSGTGGPRKPRGPPRSKLGRNDLVHVADYSPFAAMTAIEIGHPKMDVGTSSVRLMTVEEHLQAERAPMALVSARTRR